MADLKNMMKNAWVKGMETIGTAATNIANGTKTKVQEMNLVTRRNELYSSLSEKVYELWQKGAALPEELETMLKELTQIDEDLNELRAERVAEAMIAEEKAASGKAPTIQVPEEAEAAEAAEEVPAAAEAPQAPSIEVEYAADEPTKDE